MGFGIIMQIDPKKLFEFMKENIPIPYIKGEINLELFAYRIAEWVNSREPRTTE